MNSVRWTFLLLLAIGLLSSIESAVAGGASAQIASRAPPGALRYPLSSVHCFSPQRCVGLGQNFFATTTDGGRAWASYRISRANTDLETDFDGLACPTPNTCMAVGDSERQVGNGKEKSETYRAAVARTSDGGRTWTPGAPLPIGAGPILGPISCPTKSLCLLTRESTDHTVGGALGTTNMGRSWRRVGLPKGDVLSGVTCETRRFCLATGVVSVGKPVGGYAYSIITTTNGGATWRPSSLPGGVPDGDPNLVNPTCTANRCYVVGFEVGLGVLPTGSIIESNDQGKTWTNAVLPAGRSALNVIACASATECVAGSPGTSDGVSIPRPLLTTTDSGTTWVARSLPESLANLDGVSCPTVTWCMAVGTGPQTRNAAPPVTVVVTDNGGASWTVP
jgi:photosystem II stability/assembly factor-like uncharacterized protein